MPAVFEQHWASIHADYNGEWVKGFILKGKAGKALDQWGWDSREMWLPFTRNHTVLQLLAEQFFVPILKGYLDPSSEEVQIGGRAVLIAKIANRVSDRDLL